MSSFISRPCACGGLVQSVSADEDDVHIAVAAHNDTPRHTEWRAVQEVKRPVKRGPCICKGGDDRKARSDNQE